ncbi:COX assembly mitochondrial protein 2 homolog isoform X1 [Selaginella moellendorffii]|uniref:COX assembly mitochondrial protein 2 homolog isoform X1 n=1 Tax=Selaginella moellendorffii TaxID=88036 RepID=UPI000D1C8CCB|nr:COX assembly mitochondrial protein 2 homolog isoform X1 [Selaginella moellendorffii]|eukprot:XP_024543505.1 COX assembly mitochondrial protein 2 homolog isoform X1 [Selaginella moellendorffii]
MHPPLVLHKHPLCTEIITLFLRCHEDHPAAKFWGKCNDLKLELVRCLQEEKAVKRKKNFEKSKEFQAKLHAYLEDLRSSARQLGFSLCASHPST